MNGFNKVIIMGTLGKDAEVKAIEGGNSVANFSLAVNEVYVDKATGERKEKTEWIRVEAWKGYATFLGQFGKKGTTFLVEGKLKTDTYEKDGVSITSTKVVAESINFAGAKPSTVQAAPIQTAPIQAAPIQAAPVQAAPVQAAPIQAAPVQAAPVQAAPVQAAPVQAAQQVQQYVTSEQFANGMTNSSNNDMPF